MKSAQLSSCLAKCAIIDEPVLKKSHFKEISCKSWSKLRRNFISLLKPPLSLPCPDSGPFRLFQDLSEGVGRPRWTTSRSSAASWASSPLCTWSRSCSTGSWGYYYRRRYRMTICRYNGRSQPKDKERKNHRLFVFQVSTHEVLLGGGGGDRLALDEAQINSSLEAAGMPFRLQEG